MWRVAASSCSNDGSRFRGVQRRAIDSTSSTLQEDSSAKTRNRMDERQQQLVAAAEAMRTWVYKQRAMWAEGYPHALVHGQAQLASAAATAIALPSAVALPSTMGVDTPTLPVEPWSE